jgi:XisH protein
MSVRDSIHDLIKAAVIRDGWQITDDPYVISYGERFLFVDLAAIESSGVIGAEREGKSIAIEIKQFRGQSAIADLEQAIGQYMLYKLLLSQVDPGRDLYLAIPEISYDSIFSEPVGELVIRDLPLKLIVVSLLTGEIVRWIPS